MLEQVYGGHCSELSAESGVVMRRLFGGKKREDDEADNRGPNTGIDAKLALLDVALGSAVFQTEKAIREFIEYPTDSEAAYRTVSWMTRVTLFGGYLHLIQRFAFAEGGSEARDPLQDYLMLHGVRDLANSSFSPGNSNPDTDFDDWLDRVVSEAVEGIGELDDYLSECTILAGDTSFDDSAVLTRFASQLADIFDLENDVGAQLQIWSCLVDGLVNSQLKQQTEHAAR